MLHGELHKTSITTWATQARAYHFILEIMIPRNFPQATPRMLLYSRESGRCTIPLRGSPPLTILVSEGQKADHVPYMIRGTQPEARSYTQGLQRRSPIRCAPSSSSAYILSLQPDSECLHPLAIIEHDPVFVDAPHIVKETTDLSDGAPPVQSTDDLSKIPPEEIPRAWWFALDPGPDDEGGLKHYKGFDESMWKLREVLEREGPFGSLHFTFTSGNLQGLRPTSRNGSDHVD
jgi:hypothetical protein